MNDRAGITSTSNTSHEEMKQTALKRDALVACMPVEICMRQGGWASISKGSVIVLFKWFTIAWTCSSSRFRQTSGSFNDIWSDMGTEKNIITDSNGSGGIIGITNQKAALMEKLGQHF
jgi:hypothetical protein